MCCELRNQVWIIASVGFVLTAFSSIGVFQFISGAIQGVIEIWVPLPVITIYVFRIVAYTLCLDAVRCSKKNFLIPLMVLEGISIIMCTILAAILIVSGYPKMILDRIGYDEEMSKVFAGLDEADIINIFIFISLASIGLSVYILATLVKFYLQLSSLENQPSQPAREFIPLAGIA